MKREFFAAGILGMIALLTVGRAKADDLTTLSGTTYRNVRAVRVEPDGVTWQHDGGVVKVDFADSPESVRHAYHYDPAKSAVYLDTQAKERQQADARAQALVRAHEEHQRERVRMTLQNTSETSSQPGGGGTVFTLRRRLDAESAAAASTLDEQAQAKKAAREMLTRDNGTIWDRRLWAIPSLITGGYSPGVAFEPGANLNPHEFRASVHHPPGGYPPTALQDSFNTPMYMTRSYYEDVERAEAFARGVPLKP